MKKSPLVSIIMPTHNRSAFLLESLESILSQSYSNWELIIVADACTDNTNELIEPFLKDDRICFIETELNIGGAGARNMGLNMAKGEYISFLDDDDIWNHDKTKIQLDFLQKNPHQKLVYCNFNQWFQNGKKNEIILNLSTSYDELLILNLIGSFSFVMLKASELQKIRIDPELKSCQDWDLWTKVLRNSTAQNCNLNLVDYRMHGQKKISTNNDSISNGYQKWYNNNKEFMNYSLKSFHETVIKIKKEKKLYKCFKFGLIFVLKNPVNFYLNSIILKAIYSKVFK